VNTEKYTKSDEGDFILINITEELVKAKVSEIIQGIDMCHCKKCQLNACAIALNALPPQYVTTTKGALLAALNNANINYQTGVVVEVTKALLTVKECPLH
jgi:competence protein ComFB